VAEPSEGAFREDPVADTQGTRTSGFELRDYFRILWLRKWTALLIMALVIGGVLALSYRQTPVFGAKVKLLVPEQTTTSIGGIQINRDPLNLETEAQLAASPVIAELVKAPCPVSSIGMSEEEYEEEQVRCEQMAWSDDLEPFRLIRFIEVAPVKGTQFLLFEAEHRNRERAASLAHWFAAEYLDYRNRANQAQFAGPLAQNKGHIDAKEEQLRELEAELRELNPESAEYQPTLNEIARLESELSQARLEREDLLRAQEAAGSSGTITEDARVRNKPVRPDHVRDGILAAIVGLVLGIGAAFLRDYVDDSLRGVDDVERQSGATLIGVIPHVSAQARGQAQKDDRKARKRGAVDVPYRREYVVSIEDPKAPATEAYRTLRTNLMFLSVGGPLRRLLVTSPVLGEGKSTTAANLAVTMAQAGQRVLLVGTDLRRPSVHRFFGLTNRVGLSSVLAGQATLAEAVHNPGITGLRVMPGGPIPPNPAELLGSRSMNEFLTEAAQVTDWVILDAPPVLGLADASVLATLADGVLFVVNEGTNRRVLAHARDQLQKVRGRTVGTVLNNFGPAFSYYYQDYYAYTSSYYHAAAEDEDGRLSRRQRRKARKERERREKETAKAGLSPNGDRRPVGAAPGQPAREGAASKADRFVFPE
jgi:capsular exopolysaccharide synthesis family protein